MSERRDTGAHPDMCVDDHCEICGEYESECECSEKGVIGEREAAIAEIIATAMNARRPLHEDALVTARTYAAQIERMFAPAPAEATEADEPLPDFLRCPAKQENHGVLRQCVKGYEHDGEHEAHGSGGVIRWAAEATERSEP